MSKESKQIEIALPDSIRDFVFDLHDATRRSFRIEDVQNLYETRFKEISDKYFTQSMWPNENSVASECDDDHVFLLFYRELTLRHFFAKQKHIQITPYLQSWATYNKIFDLLISNPSSFIAITPQWAYDIVQEFVYQFQSFSQFRSQTQDLSESDIQLLTANKEAWSLSAVSFVLSRTVHLASSYPPSGSIHYLLGYFSIVELARVECLVCDYSSALQTVSPLSFSHSSRSELFASVPLAHLNLFYHTAVSLLMLRRYKDALDLFSAVSLHIARLLKPGALAASGAGSAGASQYLKTADKILSLAALCATLFPDYHLEQQVTDLITSKLSAEKLRRLRTAAASEVTIGSLSIFREIFDSSCPKFVSLSSAWIPGGVSSSEVRASQTEVFLEDCRQLLGLSATKAHLSLYSSIQLSKLANFTSPASESAESAESQLIAHLLSLSHRACQQVGVGLQSIETAGPGHSLLHASQNTTTTTQKMLYTLSVKYQIHGSNISIENSSGSCGGASSREDVARYFLAGIRKNSEMTQEVEKLFRVLG